MCPVPWIEPSHAIESSTALRLHCCNAMILCFEHKVAHCSNGTVTRGKEQKCCFSSEKDPASLIGFFPLGVREVLTNLEHTKNSPQETENDAGVCQIKLTDFN